MDPSFFIGIMNNITLLLAVGFLYSVCIRQWDIESAKGKVAAGLLFGCVAMIGMIFPVKYAPGLIFDGRTILLGIIGFFGGCMAAAVAVLMTSALRVWQGGVGMPMGVATIVSAAAVGVFFHWLRRRIPGLTKLFPLYCFGLLIHLAMLSCTVFLPENTRWQVLGDIAIPVMLIYPVGTMLYGLLIVELEMRDMASNTLKESEQMYAALAETSTMGIGLRDEEGRFVYVNHSLATMLQADHPSQLIGLYYIDFVYPEDQEESLRRIQANIGGEKAFRREHRLVSRRGRILMVESTGVPINRSGRRYVMGIFNDVSERVGMEQTLRENEERYRAVMQQSTEAIILAEIDSKQILEVNSRCAEMFGYTEEEMLSLSTYDLVADSRENIERRSLAIRNGTEPIGSLLPVRCKDGRIIEVERSATIIQYCGKQVFMFVNRDLTAERKLKELILSDVAMASGVQKDLLPCSFDDLLVSVETVFEPCQLVSGDFFDFKWSEGHQRFSGFILDVSGHGVSSSLQCIAVSTYFRDVLDSPMNIDAKLKWVNRHVLRYFTHETFAAALCFEFDFTRKTLTFATAGIYGFLSSSVELPRVVRKPGSLLGILEDPEYTEWTIPIRAGDTFYFMSDGLFDIVSCNESIQTENFSRTVANIRGIAGKSARKDDCSAVCIRINDRPTFPVRLEYHRYGEYDRIRDRIKNLLKMISSKDAAKIEIAVGEALVNAARESMDVQIKISLLGSRLLIRIRDGGEGFCGNQIVTEFRSLELEEFFLERLYAEGGRGILIMMSWMDDVIYNKKGNEVLLVKRLA